MFVDFSTPNEPRLICSYPHRYKPFRLTKPSSCRKVFKPESSNFGMYLMYMFNNNTGIFNCQVTTCK
jgi:hypothetical protein